MLPRLRAHASRIALRAARGLPLAQVAHSDSVTRASASPRFNSTGDAAAVTAAAVGTSPSPGARVRPILTYPDPVLRATCTPVPSDALHGVAVAQLVRDLLATAAAAASMGCAAPQIGEAVRAFVVRQPVVRNDAEATARRGELLRLHRRRRQAQQQQRRLDERSGGAAPLEGGDDDGGSGEAAEPPPSYIACVNPSIVAHGEGTEIGLESCLSIPDYVGLVRRYAVIDVEYFCCTPSNGVGGGGGTLVRERLSGLPAVVFQHELDHLDGVLLTDRELSVFPLRSREEEYDHAYEKWQLGIMKFYGMTPA